MTTYAKITDFASKDALLTGNPAKIVKGVEIDDEFNAIATADATSVKGPIGVTVDNTVARWDGTTGRAVQGSGVTISDADVVTASGFTGPHNGTVGATTPNTGAFTTLSASGAGETLTVGGASSGSNHVQYFRNTSGYGALAIPSATDQYLVGSTAGDLAIGTNNKSLRFGNFGTGALQATLDTAGNLGLGVTPSAWVSSAKPIETIYTSSGMDQNGAAFIAFNAYRGVSNWIYKSTDEAGMYTVATDGKHIWNTAPSGTAGNAITFTQAMTLDASGNLLHATSAPVSATQTGIQLSAGDKTLRICATTGTTNTTVAYFYNGNGIVGSITTSGSATAYNVSSDERLKENIVDADPSSALVDSLQVRQFDWKSDGQHQRYGFVAQELLQVVPEAVSVPEDTEQMMAVDYSKLVPLLVKEVQSLRARLAALEAA